MFAAFRQFRGDGFGVQLLARARYEIGERCFLDAGLRYLSAGEVTMDGEGATTGRVTTSIRLTFQKRLAQGARPATP